MKCPACKVPSLEQHSIEVDLPALACQRCGGIWISGAAYWKWIKDGSPALPTDAAIERSAPEVSDDGPAKLCPLCGRLLIRFKVGHGTGFHVERCGECAGMWFDAREWEILRGLNLHRRLHLLCSDDGQAAIAREQRQAAYEEFLLEKLGVADLGEIKRVKAWIDQHPRRSELYAYLMKQVG
jgi:Zn-finger nucleic acid-binding protein